MSLIQPIAQTFKLVDPNGYYTAEFKRYLDLLLARVGGITGGIYNQLTITSGAISWDVNASPNAFVTLNGTGITITPINLVAGLLNPYRLQLIQDNSGSRTVTWASVFKFPGGVKPTLSTGAGALDEFWMSSDGTNMYIVAAAGNLH